jgi:hypothetical protein
MKNVTAGLYRVSAGRAGYLTLQYGQRQPREEGSTVQVRNGQVVEHIDFTLPAAVCSPGESLTNWVNRIRPYAWKYWSCGTVVGVGSRFQPAGPRQTISDSFGSVGFSLVPTIWPRHRPKDGWVPIRQPMGTPIPYLVFPGVRQEIVH